MNYLRGTLPKRPGPQEAIAYNFPDPRRIYWGPNQRIAEDFIYIEPSGWDFYEALEPPKVVRFINDSSIVDSDEEGTGTVGFSYTCVITYDHNDPGTGLNQCVFGSNSWTGVLFPFGIEDAENLGVVAVWSGPEFVVGYIPEPIELCSLGGFGPPDSTTDIGGLISGGYFINPASHVTFHWENGYVSSHINSGVDCTGTPACPDDYPSGVPCS